MTRRISAVWTVLTLSLITSVAHSGSFSDPGAAGFTPRVPLSAFTRPAAWFDPSRLHLSSTLAFGSGFSGGSNGLQTTSLQYQFKAPVTMSVSLGNAFGAGSANGSSFFLQGLDLSWRPNSNSLFRVTFEDVRSPLQYGYGFGQRRGLVDPAYTPY